ncbi:unnamed protein product, partial [Urochloa humidicola]
ERLRIQEVSSPKDIHPLSCFHPPALGFSIRPRQLIFNRSSGATMTTDQPVISLRPGGGGIGLRVPRLFPTAFAAAAGAGGFLRPHGGSSTGFAAKLGDSRFEPLELVRYTRDQLLEMREIVDIAKEIVKLQQDINVVLLGEEHVDQNWARNDSNV